MSRTEVLRESIAGRPDAPQSTGFACAWRDRCPEGAWLRVAGVLDFSTVSQLARTLSEPALGERLIVVDLRELESIDLFGVHAIANASTRGRKLGRRIVVIRGPSHVDRMFKHAGRLDDVEIRDLEEGEPSLEVLVRLAEKDVLSWARRRRRPAPSPS